MTTQPPTYLLYNTCSLLKPPAGLNEVALGISVPKMWGGVLIDRGGWLQDSRVWHPAAVAILQQQ